jgi:hypothetical protein
MKEDITVGQEYTNLYLGFGVRVVEHRGEHGESLEPRYLVEVRTDAASPWIATTGSDDPLFFAGARVGILRRQRTLPPELGG